MVDDQRLAQLTGLVAWYLRFANTSYEGDDSQIIAALPQYADQLNNTSLDDIINGSASISVSGQSINIAMSPETLSIYFETQGIGDNHEMNLVDYLVQNGVVSDEDMSSLFNGVTFDQIFDAMDAGTITDAPSLIRAVVPPQTIERVFGRDRAISQHLIDAPATPEVEEPEVPEAPPAETTPTVTTTPTNPEETATLPNVESPAAETPSTETGAASPPVATADGTHAYAPQPVIQWGLPIPSIMSGGAFITPTGDPNEDLGASLHAAREAGSTIQGRTLDDARNDGVLNAWVGTTDVDNFFWEAHPDDIRNNGSPTPHFRNILGSIATEPDPERRALLVSRAYQMVGMSALSDDLKGDFLQATQFIGSYLIEAGGTPEAANQLTMYWNALDQARTNGGSLVDAFASVNGVTRAEAQTSLTRMSLISGARMLQDGVPMDDFNEILGNLMFDDQQASMGAQVMLDILYGPHSGLATDQMRHDMQAILALPPEQFAVSYASYMDQVMVPFVGQHLDQFTQADLEAIFTDEQMAQVQQIATAARANTNLTTDNPALATANDAGAAIYGVTNRQANYASAPAVYYQTHSDGTVATPEDNPETMLVNEAEGFDEVKGRFEDLAEEIPHAFLEFIQDLFSNILTGEAGRNNFLSNDFNHDGQNMRAEVNVARTEVQTTDPDLATATNPDVYPAVAAPEVPTADQERTTTPTTTATPPEHIDPPAANVDFSSKLMELFSQTHYPVTAESFNDLSTLFRFDTNENHQLDSNEGAFGAAGGLLFRLLDHVEGGKSWAETEAALQELCPAYIPMIRQWLYGNDNEIDEEARQALEQMMASNPDFQNLYQIRCEHYGIQPVGLDSHQGTGYNPSVDQGTELG
ncbi:hypothetical protein GC177_03280 [bacterium]|nr:hypothetical protein [bacterium]